MSPPGRRYLGPAAACGAGGEGPLPTGWVCRNEPGRERRWESSGRLSGPPAPRTILIQMRCPLKGTAVSRLRECHCRFLLPGGPRRPPASGDVGAKPGQASAARARPGPGGEQKVPRGPAAPRSPGLPAQHGGNAPATACTGAARRDGRPMLWEPSGVAVCGARPWTHFLPQLGMPHGTGSGTALHRGCAGYPHAQGVPTLPTDMSRWVKPGSCPPQDAPSGCGRTQPLSTGSPQPLPCVPTPRVRGSMPRGSASAPTCAHGAGTAGRWPCPGWAAERGPHGTRWARGWARLLVPGGGRQAPVSSSVSRARRGEGPACAEV